MSAQLGSDRPTLQSARRPGSASRSDAAERGASATPDCANSVNMARATSASAPRPTWIAPRGLRKGWSEKAGSGDASSGPLALVSGWTVGPP